MMGIDIDRVIVFTFVIGSALAGAAGVMFALRVPTAASIGFVIGLKGFTAAVDRRHRLDPGRDGRRPDPRPRRGLHRGLLDDALVGSRHLLAADRVHGLPADAACSDRRGSRRYERDPAPRRQPRGARRPRDRQGRVGRAPRRAPLEARRLDRRDRGAPAARCRGGAGSSSSCAAFALLPAVAHSSYVQRVAFETVLYMLLALGLNVVVGWGGLLDLGYVAFYGIGAYSYACSTPTSSASTCPRSSSIPLVVVIGAVAGFLVGLPSRRLVGDYLAIVTLFFLQLFLTVATNGDQIFGHDVTGGANGILNVDPFEIFGQALAVEHQGAFAVAYSTSRSRSSRSSTSRCTSSTTRAPAAPGARCARTRSRPRRWACPSTCSS